MDYEVVLCVPRATHNVPKKPTTVRFNTIVKNNCTINVLDCTRVVNASWDSPVYVIGSQNLVSFWNINFSFNYNNSELRCNCKVISIEAFVFRFLLFVSLSRSQVRNTSFDSQKIRLLEKLLFCNLNLSITIMF